jgi:hypothetical protein
MYKKLKNCKNVLHYVQKLNTHIDCIHKQMEIEMNIKFYLKLLLLVPVLIIKSSAYDKFDDQTKKYANDFKDVINLAIRDYAYLKKKIDQGRENEAPYVNPFDFTKIFGQLDKSTNEIKDSSLRDLPMNMDLADNLKENLVRLHLYELLWDFISLADISKNYPVNEPFIDYFLASRSKNYEKLFDPNLIGFLTKKQVGNLLNYVLYQLYTKTLVTQTPLNITIPKSAYLTDRWALD